VGGAIIASGFECTISIPVRPGGGAAPILPLGYGIMLAPILGENIKSVTTPNGNMDTSNGLDGYSGKSSIAI
jgi:hypothetical protein